MSLAGLPASVRDWVCRPLPAWRRVGWRGALAGPAVLVPGGWLLLVLGAAAGSRLHGVPAGLPPGWLAAGVAAAMLIRWPGWRMSLAIGLLQVGVRAVDAAVQPQAVTGTAVWLALAQTAVGLLQAMSIADAVRTLWTSAPLDRREIHSARLVQLLRFGLEVVAPRAVLAGAMMAVVRAVAPQSALPGFLPLWQLGLVYAAASGLSVLLLTPLLWGGRIGAARWPTCLALVLACAASVVACQRNGVGLYVQPLLAMAAGYIGGLWLAALCCVSMGAGLILGIQHTEMPPFEGPDGFIVMLLYVWRLAVAGYLASAWCERRGSASTAPRHGAQVYRDARAMARQWSPAGEHGDAPSVLVLVNWHGSADHRSADAASAARVAGRNSEALATDIRRLAARLRGADGLAPFSDEGLLMALADLPRAMSPGVCRRIGSGLRRDHPDLRLSMFPMSHRALALCLVSATYFESDFETDGPVPSHFGQWLDGAHAAPGAAATPKGGVSPA